MVIDDFNLLGIAFLPLKAHTIALIDPDAVLPRPVAAQSLQPIPRRYRQFGKIANAIQLV